MCMGSLPAYISVPHTYAWCQKKALGALERELQLIVSCYKCWESNPGHQQLVLLATELSLQLTQRLS